MYDRVLFGVVGEPAVEVVTAGGQHRAVGAEAPVPHHRGHITQDVPLPLLIQTLQDVGAVHRGLKGERRRARGQEWHDSFILSLRQQREKPDNQKSILGFEMNEIFTVHYQKIVMCKFIVSYRRGCVLLARVSHLYIQNVSALADQR